MVEISQIKPFYQVIIFEINGKFDLINLKNSFLDIIKAKNSSSLYYLELKKTIKDDDNIYIAHLMHKYSPSWFSEKQVLKEKAINDCENVENDLLILYFAENYLFIHSQCSTVLSLIELTIEKLNEPPVLKFNQLNAKKIQTILNNYSIQFRTLAISNIYNAGGSAPESKAYYSKNARFCLSSSFDSGFGFNYCLGIYQDENKKFHPFGISSKKSKIWGTWVDNIKTFFDNCNELVELINNDSANNTLQILVSPTSPPDFKKISILQFYMDYNIQQKGMIFLEKGDIKLDWYCYLDEKKKNQILFNIQQQTSQSLIEINFNYNTIDECFNFAYNDINQNLNVIIWNETDEIDKKKRIDLVEYLNKQNGYTILLTGGIAYRDGTFWKDNRFSKLYEKTLLSIDWNNVDIRRENKKARKQIKINIFERLKQYSINTLNCLIGINDNGSNEIADLIVITKEKFILIHAKYSVGDKAGLRVEDVQVVIAQALKNLRYFISDNFSDDKIQRLYNNIFASSIKYSFDEFKNLLFSSLNNFEIKKECWIVQPGLSKSDLENDKDNKIHILLNYAESTCLSNGIDFSFYGNK